MDTYNAYTHTYAHVYKHLNVYAFLRSLHAFIYSSIHAYTHTIHANMHIWEFTLIDIKYPFPSVSNIWRTHTHSNILHHKNFHGNHSFQTTIRSFSCSFFLCFCTYKSNATVYTLIIHGKKYTARKAPNFRSEEKITKSENTNVLF